MYRRTKVGQKCHEDAQRPSGILTRLRPSVHSQLKPIVQVTCIRAPQIIMRVQNKVKHFNHRLEMNVEGSKKWM
jgi:hypothetical protein